MAPDPSREDDGAERENGKGPASGDQGLPLWVTAHRRAGPYLFIGWNFVGPMVLGLALGWYLDKTFGWDPWAKLIGLLAGIAVGFVLFFQLVLGWNDPKGRGRS